MTPRAKKKRRLRAAVLHDLDGALDKASERFYLLCEIKCDLRREACDRANGTKRPYRRRPNGLARFAGQE